MVFDQNYDGEDAPWRRNPSRCRLCRFPVELGDLIINAGAEKQPPRPYSIQEYKRDKVNEQQREFCGREQVWPDIIRYHEACHEFAASVGSCDFGRTTGRVAEPPASEDARRQARTEYVLGRRLQTVVMPTAKLPLEIWMIVAQYLVRECAIVQMQELWDQARRRSKKKEKKEKQEKQKLAVSPPENEQETQNQVLVAAQRQRKQSTASTESSDSTRSRRFHGLVSKRRPEAHSLLPVRLKDFRMKAHELRPSKQPSTSRALWAYYINVDGVRYVSKLTNKPRLVQSTLSKGYCPTTPDLSNAPVMIFDGNSNSADSMAMVHVLSDHFGIRNVIFTNHSSASAQAFLDKMEATWGPCVKGADPDCWWRSMPARDFKHIKVSSDGLKIHFSGYTKNLSWTTPMATPDDMAAVELFQYGIDRGMYGKCKELLMNSVVCNAPDVVGYSIMYVDTNVCTILAHRAGDDGRSATSAPASFYQRYKDWYAPLGVWVYFPLDPGEHIAHVLMRHGMQSVNMALVLLTNKGRPLVMAPALSRHNLHDDEDSIIETVKFCSLPGGDDGTTLSRGDSGGRHPLPTTIYYNVSTRGIRWIGVRNALTSSSTFPDVELEPPSQNPADRLPDPVHGVLADPAASKRPYYFYSSVESLEGAVRLTPYRGPPLWLNDPRGGGGSGSGSGRRQCPSQISGLLVEYGDESDGERHSPSSETRCRPRVACLGECRLDMAGPTLDLAGSTTLRLGFVQAPHVAAQPYVTRLEINDGINTFGKVNFDGRSDGDDDDGNDDGLFWLSVPWKGKLEWWFDHGHCKVFSSAAASSLGGGESPSYYISERS